MLCAVARVLCAVASVLCAVARVLCAVVSVLCAVARVLCAVARVRLLGCSVRLLGCSVRLLGGCSLSSVCLQEVEAVVLQGKSPTMEMLFDWGTTDCSVGDLVEILLRHQLLAAVSVLLPNHSSRLAAAGAQLSTASSLLSLAQDSLHTV